MFPRITGADTDAEFADLDADTYADCITVADPDADTYIDVVVETFPDTIADRVATFLAISLPTLPDSVCSTPKLTKSQ